MHYKTIALELIRENPPLHERLRAGKMLLTAMEAYAIDLKQAHEDWKDRLAWSRTGGDSIQLASEAMELAIRQIQGNLPSESPASEADTPPLDAAMNEVRPHTPSA